MGIPAGCTKLQQNLIIKVIKLVESTIGAKFFSQTSAVNAATVKFEIWDTSGQEDTIAWPPCTTECMVGLKSQLCCVQLGKFMEVAFWSLGTIGGILDSPLANEISLCSFFPLAIKVPSN
ncbi:hypothetical protein PIB30_066023 [Stylosanthes scabra]|uniref:Uncharacterized protein n=1 Tax=Stylosanthes scabra TaxID=79078 RepID=A0ABU6ZKW8_9FABA|nr:hypothetical protein [Stylosanthes scabra]